MTTMTLQTIFGGDLGAIQTLTKMKSLVNDALRDPLVVEQARQIVEDFGASGRDEIGKALAIHDWMENHLTFIPDPVGVELLATPHYLIQRIQRTGMVSGDCDDTAILSAALGKAVGLKAKFRAMGFRKPGAAFRHVVTYLLAAGRWVNLDTTRNPRFAVPPAPSRIYEMRV